MEGMKTDKVRTTVWVSGDKVELAKKRGYKVSSVTEEALDTILNIYDYEELKVQIMITGIDEEVKKLEFKKGILLKQLNDKRVEKILHEEDAEKTRIFNRTVNELQTTMDIKTENLETNAKLIGITPEELYRQAKKEVGW
jgi:hypothetical protein